MWHIRQLVVGRGLGSQAGLRADRPEELDPGPEPARRQRMGGSEVVVERGRAEHEQRQVAHGGHDSGDGPGRHREPPRPVRLRPTGRPEYHPSMGTDLVVVLIIVLAVVLIWRGPKTLPKIGQALGRGSARRARRRRS